MSRKWKTGRELADLLSLTIKICKQISLLFTEAEKTLGTDASRKSNKIILQFPGFYHIGFEDPAFIFLFFDIWRSGPHDDFKN